MQSFKNERKQEEVCETSLFRCLENNITRLIAYQVTTFQELKADQNGRILLVFSWHSCMTPKTCGYLEETAIVANVGIDTNIQGDQP